MNSGEWSPGTPLDIAAALMDEGIGAGPVSRVRRLVPVGIEERGRIFEFHSTAMGGRMLAIQRGTYESQRHAELAEQGMPVLPEHPRTLEGLMLISAPLGTNALRSRLHIITNDLWRFGGLLTDIVATQQRQYDANLGVVGAPGESVLDRFALVEASGTDFGQRPYLLPPYDVEPGGTPETFAARLEQEILATAEHAGRAITGRQAEHLHELIAQGVAGGPTS